MRETGIRKVLSIATLVVALAMLVVAPALAQFGRFGTSCSGEPTDPDGTYLLLLEGTEIDLADYGLDTEPQTEAEAESWFEAFLDLLRSLGLWAGEEGSE